MAKGKATLNIDPELHRELKLEAVKRGVKLSEFAEQLLREGLKKAR
jgi:predicted HicB family RNase H-like nuclease